MGKVKLKGSTLVEVIVAMLITMVTFGIAMVIIVNTFKSAGFGVKFTSRISLNNVALNTIEGKQFIDKDTVIDEIRITQKISSYQSVKGLSILSLSAMDGNGRLLDRTAQLIIEP